MRRVRALSLLLAVTMAVTVFLPREQGHTSLLNCATGLPHGLVDQS